MINRNNRYNKKTADILARSVSEGTRVPWLAYASAYEFQINRRLGRSYPSPACFLWPGRLELDEDEIKSQFQ